VKIFLSEKAQLSDVPNIENRPPKNTGLPIGFALVLGVLLVWEALVRVRQVPPYLLPAPSLIAQILWAKKIPLLLAGVWTLWEALLGLVLGFLAGFALALFARRYSQLESGILWVAVWVKSTPIVAIAPLLTLWLGFGIFPKVILTALLTFFPVLVNSLTGFASLLPHQREWFQSVATPPAHLLWLGEIPSALPYLFAALRVVAPLSLVGAVVAEWAGASAGLGRLMWLAYTNLDIPTLFAAIALLALQGASLYQGAVWLEGKLLHWRQPE
jgi:ABC-type nitrate/sulfonate/bicarbonate transport system permease component